MDRPPRTNIFYTAKLAIQPRQRQQRNPSQGAVRPRIQPQLPTERDICSLGHSQINNLKTCLVDYPCKNIATSLLNGFQKSVLPAFHWLKDSIKVE